MAIQALELATVARRFRAVRPERDYVWNKTAPGDVGSDGRQAIDALLANALLPSEHQGSVLRSVSHWLQRMTDLADRKMVAAALAALDAGHATRITNAADTDWIDCQQALHAVEPGMEADVPTTQDWHLVWPLPFPKVPASQTMQSLSPMIGV